VYPRRLEKHLEGHPRAVEFVEYAERLVRHGVPVLFSPAHLAWTLGVPFNEMTDWAAAPPYREFFIAKRRGGVRRIEAPEFGLKYVQTQIRRTITSRLPVADCAHGFVPGRSIVTNAAPHVGKAVVAKFDIEDYFGSIDASRVSVLLTPLGYAPSVVTILSDLCTLNGRLPQGAPTSPDLANATSVGLDRDLLALATSNGLSYTRYADDLTFSGDAAGHPSIRAAVDEIVRRHEFRLNEEKTAILSRATQQRVTGIVVNDRSNWPRDTRRWIRQQVHYLERYGVDGHLRREAERDGVAGGRVRANYRDFIYGHVYALHSVRPDEAVGYLQRLDALSWPGVPAPG
jgi:RNA-directed DNA polymerase